MVFRRAILPLVGVVVLAVAVQAQTVPVGTQLDVRLQGRLDSNTAEPEDRFEATTVTDLMIDGETAIPAGSVVHGVVASAEEAGRLDRRGRLSLRFESITIDGRDYPLRATPTEAIEAELGEEAAKVGAGAGVGGIIGGILGGVEGALAGILIGAGGVIAGTEGEDVELPEGTILRLRLDSPLDID